MPPISGYSAQLPTDVILGSLIILVNATTAYGATSGEVTVNLPHEYVNLDFDGKIGIPIVGLDRRMGGVPSIEATMIEINATKALALEPGGTTATAGAVTTITPKRYGDLLQTSDYLTNVRAGFRRGGGGVCVVEFDYALLIVDSIMGASADKGAIKIRLEARQDPTAALTDLGSPPYTIKLASAFTDIVS
jgi:hypothetical protein